MTKRGDEMVSEGHLSTPLDRAEMQAIVHCKTYCSRFHSSKYSLFNVLKSLANRAGGILVRVNPAAELYM